MKRQRGFVYRGSRYIFSWLEPVLHPAINVYRGKTCPIVFMIYALLRTCRLCKAFEDVVLLDVVVGFRIDGNGRSKAALKRCDEVLFLPME